MLKIIFHLALAALAAVSLSSCYTDFEPDIPSDPVLCLNSVIETGKPVTVDLSRTWRYSDGSYYDPDDKHYHVPDTRVMDASVSLYVGDVLKGTVDTPDVPTSANERDRSFYSFDYVACPGDEIRLVAISKKYGEAEGSVTVPHPVDIESIDFTPTSVKVFNWGYPNIEFGCAFKLTFTDLATVMSGPFSASTPAFLTSSCPAAAVCRSSPTVRYRARHILSTSLFHIPLWWSTIPRISTAFTMQG